MLIRARVSLLAICLLAVLAHGAEARERALHEGSVDACALVSRADVMRALGAKEITSVKGVLTQTWGSSCRFTGDGTDAFLSLVAHTKNGAQTFRALRNHLPAVKNRNDLHPGAYQSAAKLFLFKRGTYITIEGSPSVPLDAVAKQVLAALDALAEQQNVHR